MTTPQDIALLDARRGTEMFRKVNVPVRVQEDSPLEPNKAHVWGLVGGGGGGGGVKRGEI